ncbi:MAG: 30S ribosomal protein S12 methylthiotransferase RimO, partial [Firmicutes bacterium]|nr:30S ribosomal protein S12 methylthiotransferase RimO [Bacillota bacterium]
NGIYFGRTRFQAYEVDGQVLFTSERELQIGEFVQVRIIGSDAYDLIGEYYELS